MQNSLWYLYLFSYLFRWRWRGSYNHWRSRWRYKNNLVLGAKLLAFRILSSQFNEYMLSIQRNYLDTYKNGIDFSIDYETFWCTNIFLILTFDCKPISYKSVVQKYQSCILLLWKGRKLSMPPRSRIMTMTVLRDRN